LIRAAGGIVVRGGSVLLVHRPKYDDWAFPKGKLDEGESWEDAALRELEEETALQGELGEELGRTSYEVDGEPKEVRYFHVDAEGDARAQNEIDEVRWVPLAEANAVLTHERDRQLLDRLLR
jgi:8-oxo-dGTP pyrophosphatase MutT (NUDIX family)